MSILDKMKGRFYIISVYMFKLFKRKYGKGTTYQGRAGVSVTCTPFG